ncbi:MAG: hypothetical protein ABSB58_09070 [Gemmatimonadales bacterium]
MLTEILVFALAGVMVGVPVPPLKPSDKFDGGHTAASALPQVMEPVVLLVVLSLQADTKVSASVATVTAAAR